MSQADIGNYGIGRGVVWCSASVNRGGGKVRCRNGRLMGEDGVDTQERVGGDDESQECDNKKLKCTSWTVVIGCFVTCPFDVVTQKISVDYIRVRDPLSQQETTLAAGWLGVCEARDTARA